MLGDGERDPLERRRAAACRGAAPSGSARSRAARRASPRGRRGSSGAARRSASAPLSTGSDASGAVRSSWIWNRLIWVFIANRRGERELWGALDRRPSLPWISRRTRSEPPQLRYDVRIAMRISSSPSTNAQAMIRVGVAGQALLDGARRPAAARRCDVNGAVSDDLGGGRPLMRIVRRPSRRDLGSRRVDASRTPRSVPAGADGSAVATTVPRPARPRARGGGSSALVGPAESSHRAGARLRGGRLVRYGRSRRRAHAREALVDRPNRRRARRRGASRVLVVVQDPLIPGRVLWHRFGVLFRRLTGLADGLAPDCGATPIGDSPHLPGSPAPRLPRGLSGYCRGAS